MPDARKSLSVLREEWVNCEQCNLGVRRKEVCGEFVFGEGHTHGIMFVGEGPGVREEEEGRPFIGRSGQILRMAIERLGLGDCYITNCVSCRSCAPAYDGEGKSISRLNRSTNQYEPVIRDEPPNPAQVHACLPRLHEEIYLVDPVLIVALGGEAAKALRGKPISITTERGKTEKVLIPGAWRLPVVTDKKKAWARKVQGQLVMPVVQNMVEYLMLPTLHPAWVLRKQADKSKGNPLEMFVADMKKAATVYDRYMLEVHGVVPSERHLSIEDIQESSDEE